MGGILLKKRGGKMAYGGGRRSNSWLFDRCHVDQDRCGPSNVNACSIGEGNEGVAGRGVCDRRARGSK